MNRPEELKIPLQVHPRVFVALGADLVTDDRVALIELVKNSYDALADNVWIRFGQDEEAVSFIEVQDDGIGMSRQMIEDVWCMVATPHRDTNPWSKSEKKCRRVSGAKGLGRLSAARLGDSLELLTRAEAQPCWQVLQDWNAIMSANSLGACTVALREYAGSPPFETTGTRIRVYGLRSHWDSDAISELVDSLGRLVPPFSGLDDFRLHVSHDQEGIWTDVVVTPPQFLYHPKYLLRGRVDGSGNINYEYQYWGLGSDGGRSDEGRVSWPRVTRLAPDDLKPRLGEQAPSCGPFDFELRAWDLDPGGTEEVSENFGVGKTAVRRAIRAHKGITVYRDGILVLPKTDNSRDWLGIDLRRVSKVGTRMSTSQIVGLVSIGSDTNPGITDTSDRERLATTKEVHEFRALLLAAVAQMENERDRDRRKPVKERPLESLFDKISAEGLVSEVQVVAQIGGEATEVLPLVRAFDEDLARTRNDIQERFVYYSRLATIGTIAQMLVHEIRNRTTVFGVLLRRLAKHKSAVPSDVVAAFEPADRAVDSLESLADTFAPLASRSFRRGARHSDLADRIEASIGLHRAELDRLQIQTEVDVNPDLRLAVDPGELDAVVLNLVSNAAYWLSEVPPDGRKLSIVAVAEPGSRRATVTVSDSGPGIREEDIERVMWPGVTRKPNGIGMGLTVSAEIVAKYSGRLGVTTPGDLGGATFQLDLPISESERR